METFSFSAGTILQLYINYPHWRLAVGLRIFATLLASTTIACDVLILRWRPVPAGVPWWKFQSLNTGIPFVVCSLSIIWTVLALIKLFITHKPIHPGADIGFDLLITLLLTPTIVFAVLGPPNHWNHDGKNGFRTPAGKLELVATACLIIMLSIHFSFFVWACRRVDVKRRLERRESCDRCLAIQLREKMASRGSDIEPMPSRAYHRPQDMHGKISPTSTSPTAVSPINNVRNPPTPPTPPKAALTPSFKSPLFTETIPYPRIGARYHELDVDRGHRPNSFSSPQRPQYHVRDIGQGQPSYPSSSPQRPQHWLDDLEQGHAPIPRSNPQHLHHQFDDSDIEERNAPNLTSSHQRSQYQLDDSDRDEKYVPRPLSTPQRPRYQFDDSEDDEPTPPTPPPKSHFRERENRPPLPRLHAAPNGKLRPQDFRKDESKLGRAYSISSYYYSNPNDS